MAKKGRIKRIHVNKHIIGANRKHGRNDAPLTCKVGKENLKGHRVQVNGPSIIIHSPDKPLSCGAKVWIETHASVAVEELPNSGNWLIVE